MRRIWRLLGYARPYALYTLLSLVTTAVFAAMAALRVMLIKPIVDNVLSAKDSPKQVLVFTIPRTTHVIDLQFLIPHHFHNAWTVVAVALVGSAIIKSVCDYLGTLLANKAGFGMITDLRNDFYDSMMRRSTAFFQRHTSGTLISTLINDVERVQTAMATILSDFLQQTFTLIVMIGVVVITGGAMALVLLAFVPIIVLSSRKVGRSVRRTTRRGQDRLAEIQNIVQETITGNGIVKAFGMEHWEINRFRRASDRLLSANMRSVAVQAISSPLMDALGAVLLALLLWYGPHIFHSARRLRGHLHRVPRRGHHAVRSGAPDAACTTTIFSRPPAPASTSSASWMPRTMWSRRSGRRWCVASRIPSASSRSASPTRAKAR